MQSLIVLGIIPGTNIQVGFFGWLGVFAALFGVRYFIRRTRRKNALRILHFYASLILASRRKVHRIRIS